MFWPESVPATAWLGVDGMAARGGPDGKRAAARCSADIELSSARSSCGRGFSGTFARSILASEACGPLPQVEAWLADVVAYWCSGGAGGHATGRARTHVVMYNHDFVFKFVSDFETKTKSPDFVFILGLKQSPNQSPWYVLGLTLFSKPRTRANRL